MTAPAVPPSATTIDALLDRYAGCLLDAYGVLVDSEGALPIGRAIVEGLERRGMPYVVISNDASRAPETWASQLAARGLRVAVDRILTAGQLLADWFPAHAPQARACVLGTPASEAFVRAGGATVVPLAEGMEIDCVAVCDDAGFDFLAGTELAASAAIRALDAGRGPALVLPNPDLVYPKRAGELGVTAGAIALVIEAVLARRAGGGGDPPRFARLGKPARGLFDRGRAMLGLRAEQIVMIGDQLETDVAGARGAGIDAALVPGVSRWSPGSPITPTWLVAEV